MPDISFPPEFSRMSDSLSGAFNLDFVTETGAPNGSNPLNPTPTSHQTQLLGPDLDLTPLRPRAGEANCSLGSNHCYRIMVLMFSLLGFQLAAPAAYALARWMHTMEIVSKKRLETLVDRSIHGNATLTNLPNLNRNPNLNLNNLNLGYVNLRHSKDNRKTLMSDMREWTGTALEHDLEDLRAYRKLEGRRVVLQGLSSTTMNGTALTAE